jgi:hypothetical protein
MTGEDAVAWAELQRGGGVGRFVLLRLPTAGADRETGAKQDHAEHPQGRAEICH